MVIMMIKIKMVLWMIGFSFVIVEIKKVIML